MPNGGGALTREHPNSKSSAALVPARALSSARGEGGTVDQFSFFMGFYGLQLGLAVAELLGGFGALVRARRQPRWGLLTPLLGLDVFLQIAATFIDAWRKLQAVTIDFSGVAAPALVGIGLFTATSLAVPRDVADWPALDDYFMARRRVAIGAVVIPNLVTIAVFEAAGVAVRPPAWQVMYWSVNALLIGALLVAATTRRRRLAAVALAANILLLLVIYATPAMIPAGFARLGL